MIMEKKGMDILLFTAEVAESAEKTKNLSCWLRQKLQKHCSLYLCALRDLCGEKEHYLCKSVAIRVRKIKFKIEKMIVLLEINYA